MNIKTQWIFILVGLIIFYVLFDTVIFLPLKILTVFFHELSHALMTWLTGGKVVEMAVNLNQSGHVLSQGGNRFLILSAGYLGSLLWGASLFLIALYSKNDKKYTALLAALMIVVAILTLRNIFGFLFVTGFALFLLSSAVKLSQVFNDWLLRIIGLTSITYTPFDIIQDTILNRQARSDAYMLGEEFFGNAVFWGILWIALSLIVIVKLIMTTIRRKNLAEKGR